MINVTLPLIDENVTSYTIGKWFKQVGDHVDQDEPLLEVETDKVTMEVVAESNGTLAEIIAVEGDSLNPGDLLARINPSGEMLPRPAKPIEKRKEALVAAASTTPMPIKERRLTPVVARMVAEHNLDVAQIDGSGRYGRVTKRDVIAYLDRQVEPVVQPNVPKPVKQPTPSPATSNGNPRLPLSGMRRSIAEHMVRSLATSPHVTTLFEFDFAAVKAHRQQHKTTFAEDGVKLTYMAYIAQATAMALKKFPMVNSQFYEDGIELKREINLGVIVAVDEGLYAPVIHHADEYNLKGLARAIGDYASKAHDGQLKPQDLQGGTFTLSNHGAAGSIAGTPIIFQPQAGILGIGAIEDRVKVIDGGIQVRPCAYISFSFDHRVMDGAIADGFCSEIKRIIEAWPM